ncbi:hypothetical protein GCM10025864_33840 [Luteimicrobium album]|uniref:DUF2975 domain-containing protein n=1 Tax=Luteimicrobium album TaxID=1054550 RepID=A0ABQ6I550_9MICO|nr:DUF2975 domain-containing protein [Luteimicrobium album]GMA25625.1 hypothetical protein GCM10025864_33840 [Luteimicrobium album]
MATTWSVRVLYTVLALAAGWVLAFNVVPPLAGPDTNLAYLQNRPVPDLVVVRDTGFRERMVANGYDLDDADATMPVMFPWKDTSDGTRDAATGLPPVELSFGNTMRLTFWGTEGSSRLMFALPPLAWAALALAVLGLLYKIARGVARGDAFSPANARPVAAIAGLIAVGGTTVQLGTFALDKLGIAHSAAAGIVDVPFRLTVAPLWIGALVLLLAEVFRQGARLRTEVDGLV